MLDNKKMDIIQCFLYAAGLLATFAFGMFSFYHYFLVLVFNILNFIIVHCPDKPLTLVMRKFVFVLKE